MKVVIVEDEEKSALKLKNYLESLDSDISVMAILGSIKAATDYFNSHLEPDLIFLDVQLADGESFEIFEKVTTQAFVIFVTAYDQHSLKAFELNTVSYLLKPFNQADVANALNKYKLLRSRQEVNILEKRFAVKKGNRYYTLNTDDIAYFIKGKVLYLVAKSGEKFLMDSSLEQLERTLNSLDFHRINRSCLVNYSSIESFVSASSHRYRLQLKIPSDDDLVVSQARAADFKKWIANREMY